MLVAWVIDLRLGARFLLCGRNHNVGNISVRGPSIVVWRSLLLHKSMYGREKCKPKHNINIILQALLACEGFFSLPKECYLNPYGRSNRVLQTFDGD